MSVERLERVLWRLRKRHPDTNMVTYRQLQLAIMYECGTSPQTIRNNQAALKKLGWIAKHSSTKVRLTNKDLSGVDS